MLVLTTLTEEQSVQLMYELFFMGYDKDLVIIPLPPKAYYMPLVFRAAGTSRPLIQGSHIIVITVPKGADEDKFLSEVKERITPSIKPPSPVIVVGLNVDQHQEEGDEEYPYLAVTIK